MTNLSVNVIVDAKAFGYKMPLLSQSGSGKGVTLESTESKYSMREITPATRHFNLTWTERPKGLLELETALNKCPGVVGSCVYQTHIGDGTEIVVMMKSKKGWSEKRTALIIKTIEETTRVRLWPRWLSKWFGHER